MKPQVPPSEFSTPRVLCCLLCGGTGWRVVSEAGVERSVARCQCRQVSAQSPSSDSATKRREVAAAVDFKIRAAGERK